MTHFTAALIVMTLVAGATAQTLTLRDMVLQARAPIFLVINSPQSLEVDLFQLNFDLVVRGVVGENPVPSLSETGDDIVTDYTLENPQIVVSLRAAVAPPGMPWPPTITQLGGTMTLEGHRVTASHYGLPPLKPGTEGLFFLARTGNQYRIAGRYLGAFAIVQDAIVPLTSNADFAQRYRGKSVGQFVTEVTDRLRAIAR